MLAYILYSLLSSTDAFRVTHTALVADVMSGQAQQGQMLRDRYRLDKFLERRSKAEATPGRSFPYISSSRRKFNSSSVGHLGTGSFGDVWQAYDKKMGKTVAVKIFYQGSQYMTWLNADRNGRQELKESASECNLVKQILREEHRKMYPIGASRICECYDEYITDSKGTDNTVFLVQEMCGSSLSKAIIEKGRKSRRPDYYKARQATKQMLQAIAFLQMFDPPLIHHDLKPANVCINDKEEIKVIDWGALVFGKHSAMMDPACATPLYTPPEVANRAQSFAHPWWSYDSYALGLMHMQFVCPMVEDLDWYYQRPLTNGLVKSSIQKRCRSLVYKRGHNLDQDLALIDKLANKNPERRSKPMSLVDHDALYDIEVPKITEDEAEELLKFKAGEAIEYWSESNDAWLPGKVEYVDQRNGVYSLVHPDGRKMKSQADPGRVRKLQGEQDLRATVPDNFRVEVGNRREGNGLRGQGVVDPVGNMEGKEKRGVGYSDIISVDSPLTRWTSRNTLEVKTYVRCDYGATCDIESVWMTCGSGHDQSEYELHTQLKGNMIRAHVDVTHRDPMLGRECEIEVIGVISGAVSTKYHGKKRSYPTYVTLEAGRHRF